MGEISITFISQITLIQENDSRIIRSFVTFARIKIQLNMVTIADFVK